MHTNFWFLFIFVIAGTGILYLIEWVSTNKRPTNYVAYGLSIAIGTVAAFFIDQKIGQAIICLVVALASVGIIKVLTKVSGKGYVK